MKIVNKLWGRELWIVNDIYCGKILELNAGYSSSYHYHRIKQETFYCLDGEFNLNLEGKGLHLVAGDKPITIYSGEFHSFSSKTGAKILEVSTKHEEKDVVRKDKSHTLKLTYCFDIDGTICTQESDNPIWAYNNAAPYPEIIQKVNKLYNDGHTIKIFTARGTTTGIDWSDFTKKQLNKWGVKYHELIFGKPFADVFVDDKCVKELTCPS